MATRILQSMNPYVFALPELRLPGGGVLPAVDLPKSQYRPGETYIQGPRRGFQARPIAELTEAEQERIEASPQIMAMIERGVYRWLDEVPESMQTSEDLVAQLRAENEKLKSAAPSESGEALRARIAALEKENAALKSPAELPGPMMVRDELMSKPYAEVQKIATEYGVKKVKGVSRVNLVEAILGSAGYTGSSGPSGPETLDA